MNGVEYQSNRRDLFNATAWFLHHQLIHHWLKADAHHDSLKSDQISVQSGILNIFLPPWPCLLTCWLVMVTHWRRSLLIRYSKASSSLTSHLDELQVLVVPLANGTCWRGQREKQNTECLVLLRISDSQVKFVKHPPPQMFLQLQH